MPANGCACLRVGTTAFGASELRRNQRDIVSAFKLASEKRLSIYRCLLESPARLNLNPLSVSEAVDRYGDVLEQRSLRPASLTQTQLHLSQLIDEFGSQMCHSVTASLLEKWFQKRNWKRSTIDGVIAKIALSSVG